MSLRRKLTDFGFESNDDYEYALRCLFEARIAHLRVLHVEGNGGRRKTAFAHALAHALEYDHVLYHDCSQPEPPAPALVIDASISGVPEAPLSAFERILIEGCAYSEAARTVLILDQLQAAPFADHLRLVGFAESGDWHTGSGSVAANARHFLLVLVSEQPLYHSLARRSYRVWTDAERGYPNLRADEYGLPSTADELLGALAAVFAELGQAPTPSEVTRLLDDLMHRVSSEDQLRQSIFGWTEQVERARLFSPELRLPLQRVLDALERFLGADRVELDTAAAPDV